MTDNTPAATNGNGVTKKTQATNIKEFLAAPQIQARIKDMLGKKAGNFVTSVISIAGQDKLLAESEPRSLFNAALTAASLDLPISKQLGFAHIIGYKNNKEGIVEAQFQMGWKGFVQLAQRSGQYKKINAVAVRDGQLVEQDELAGNTFDWQAKKSDTVIGYVAFFELQNGYRQELYMANEDVAAHGKKYSKSFAKGYGPWVDNFEAMALKTVIKLLLSKWGPLSVDPVMAQAIELDQAVIRDDKVDYIDGDALLSAEEATDEEDQAILDAATDKQTGVIDEDKLPKKK